MIVPLWINIYAILEGDCLIKGKEKDQKRFCGGLIEVDHASGFIHLTNQVSLYGGETLKAKHSFEHLAHTSGFGIKKYRCDNGIFAKDV